MMPAVGIAARVNAPVLAALRSPQPDACVRVRTDLLEVRARPLFGSFLETSCCERRLRLRSKLEVRAFNCIQVWCAAYLREGFAPPLCCLDCHAQLPHSLLSAAVELKSPTRKPKIEWPRSGVPYMGT